MDLFNRLLKYWLNIKVNSVLENLLSISQQNRWVKTVNDEREKRNMIGMSLQHVFRAIGFQHWARWTVRREEEQPGHWEAFSVISNYWRSPPGGHSSGEMCCRDTALTCGQEQGFSLPFPLWQYFPMKSSWIRSSRMCLQILEKKYFLDFRISGEVKQYIATLNSEYLKQNES